MGQQQLLLIIVGVIVVGIALAVGYFMFRDSASASNRDALSNDLAYFASIAQRYYRLPKTLGGGELTFDGLTMKMLTSKPKNPNGVYTLSPDPVAGAPASITLTAVGTEIGEDQTTPVKITLDVWPDSVKMRTGPGDEN
jgi:Tfp pilus assembly protein PilE